MIFSHHLEPFKKKKTKKFLYSNSTWSRVRTVGHSSLPFMLTPEAKAVMNITQKQKMICAGKRGEKKQKANITLDDFNKTIDWTGKCLHAYLMKPV